jgi:two-component system sensor histidine kinase KdpD
VIVDRDAIAEVLYTLLDNAVKYSSTYSRIDIMARRTGGELTIAVEDEGRGIPAELRARVFEKFARADSREQGFGMGLAIAKAILDAHRGRIWIEGRRTGRGVVVSFSLPLQTVAEPVHP